MLVGLSIEACPVQTKQWLMTKARLAHLLPMAAILRVTEKKEQLHPFKILMKLAISPSSLIP